MLDAVVGDLGKITGQKAIVTKAKKSVANFKVREGMPVGAKVTLPATKCGSSSTGLQRCPARVRDFRGVNPNAFDGRGNYALGVREQLIFPRSNTTRTTRSAHGHCDLHNRQNRRRGEGAPRAHRRAFARA